MNGLSARRLLEVWERGHGRDASGRSRLLAAVATARPESEVEALPLGQRDLAVLALRCRTLGGVLVGSVRCPECGVGLTFSLDEAAVTFDRPRREAPPPVAVEADGWRLEARPPDGRDMAAAARCSDLAAARAELLRRCLTACLHDGETADAADLPDALVATLGEAVLEADPQAEVLVKLDCAACGAAWSCLLDPAVFLWDEMDAAARRLIGDVDVLARAYGWSEREILALTSARRSLYLEMAG